MEAEEVLIVLPPYSTAVTLGAVIDYIVLLNYSSNL